MAVMGLVALRFAIVTGGRDGVSQESLERGLNRAYDLGRAGQMPRFDALAVGSDRGVDGQAFRWGMRSELPVLTVPALWRTGQITGAPEGPIRNARMHGLVLPVVVLAMPGNRGTADMMKVGCRAGTPTYFWSQYDDAWLQDL
jgi:hypothetical protein